jgi:hypothetical protein
VTQQGRYKQIDDIWPLLVKNTHSETAPAHGLLLVENAEKNQNGHIVYSVTKPDGSDGTYLVNGPAAIPATGIGLATDAMVAWVAYDDGDTPAAGETWGPASGSWLLTKDESGWQIQGAGDNGKVAAARAGTGYNSLRGTVTAYDATYKVATIGSLVALPTGAKLPSGSTVKVFDKYTRAPSVTDEVWCIRNAGVYDDSGSHNTHGVVDWLIYQVGAGATLATVIVDKESMGQSAGDPVAETHSSRYFAGKLADTTPIWIKALDTKRLTVRFWLPALGEFQGLLTGTYDPDPEGESDERPLYVIQPPPAETYFGIVTSQISAADWTDDTEPILGTGQVQLFKRDATGDEVEDGSPRTVYNYGKTAIPVDEIIGVDEWQGWYIAQPTTFGNMFIARFTGTISARSGDTFGSGTADLGILNSSNEFTSVLSSQTIYNRTKSAVIAPAAAATYEVVAKLNTKWVMVSNIQMQTLSGYTEATEQHVVQCVSGGLGPQWAADAPITDFRVVDASFTIDVFTACDSWVTKYTGGEC